MKLNPSQRFFLRLISSALWENHRDGSSFAEVPPSARVAVSEHPDWRTVFLLAENQAVEGLLWRALDLGQGFDCQAEALSGLAVKIDSCERRHAFMEKACDALASLYYRRGLTPIFLKGLGSAALYPHPELRSSGDIDLFFPENEFDRAIPCEAVRHSDDSWSYLFHGIEVELHKHVLDVSEPKARRVADGIVRDCEALKAGTLYMPCPRVRILLCATHLLKHVLGRGAGLRQFCDYALARSGDDYDRQLYAEDCVRLGISRWVRVLDCLCVRYLDMQSDAGYSAREIRLADKLMLRVLREGNFGRSSGRGKGAANTLLAFVSNLPFSLRIAPKETFYNICILAKGRLK